MTTKIATEWEFYCVRGHFWKGNTKTNIFQCPKCKKEWIYFKILSHSVDLHASLYLNKWYKSTGRDIYEEVRHFEFVGTQLTLF